MGDRGYRRGRKQPGRMVGDPIWCTRCGIVLPTDGTTMCGDCARIVGRFKHGLTYLVVSDPTGTYERLGHHKDPAFTETLRFGYWSEGMIVEVWFGGRPRSVCIVEGPTCPPDMERAPKKQKLVQVDGLECKGDGVYLIPGGK